MPKTLAQQKKKKRRKKKPPLTPEQKLQRKFHKKVLELFKRMGFEYIRTENLHVTFGGQTGEFDSAFLYENIILLCEETLGKNRTGDHLRKKYDFFERILLEKEVFLKWIKNKGEEKFKRFENYTNARYKIFYLYFTERLVEENKRTLYSRFKYIDSKILRYFSKLSDCIRYSARNELYKFLDLDFKQIGNSIAGSQENIHSAVIFPEGISGMPQGVHLVSFVMTAKELLDCAYVFRKENWSQDSGYYYQRLLDKNKISNIREFLAKEQRTFIDNIIVSLPKETRFYLIDEDGEKGKSFNLHHSSEATNVSISIPYKSNSIGIIDGQHRVFGHHVGPDSKEERIIADLRQKRHLFVTGLYYEKGVFTESEKRKFESKLFLEINSKQKKVNTQILQDIESLQDPLSPIGISTSVVRKMNQRSPFYDMFLLSELDKKGIKTPTIIKYALQQLVELTEEKETLFKYWNQRDKNLLTEGKDTEEEELRNKYIDFCSDSICKFFVAVKNNFENAWTTDGSSKLMTVTSIVAFIKSFNYALEKYKGLKEISFYQDKLKNLHIDFKNKKRFPYVSSQWPKFAEQINKCWA
jgi:DGQHR domain-containing protein